MMISLALKNTILLLLLLLLDDDDDDDRLLMLNDGELLHSIGTDDSYIVHMPLVYSINDSDADDNDSDTDDNDNDAATTAAFQ